MTKKFTPQPIQQQQAVQPQAQAVQPSLSNQVDPGEVGDWADYIPAAGEEQPVPVQPPSQPVQPVQPTQVQQPPSQPVQPVQPHAQPVQPQASSGEVTPSEHDQLMHEILVQSGEESTGFEYLSQLDLILPRLKILQKLSPQLQQTQSAFVPGAVEGLIYNENSGELYTEIDFLPTVFRRLILEWHGGIGSGEPPITHLTYPQNINPADLVAQPPAKEPKIRIIEQIFMPGFLIEDGQISQHVFLSFASTQIKKAKIIINQAKMKKMPANVKPRLWFATWKLKTVLESKGLKQWYSWDPLPGQPITALRDPVAVARECGESIRHASSLFEAIQREQANNEIQSEGASPDDIPF